MAFNDIVAKFEQLCSDYACHVHNSQHDSYLSMAEVGPELVFSKSTNSSRNKLLIAGNVSIHPLMGSLSLYYTTTAVIVLKNDNMMENETKLDKTGQHAAIFIATVFISNIGAAPIKVPPKVYPIFPFQF